jgi:hypothetical protein
MTFGLAPLKNITNQFDNWLGGTKQESCKTNKGKGWCVLLFGIPRMREMIMFLTNQKLHPFYRLYEWLFTGSVYGHISNQWSNGMSWILGTTF